MLLPNPHNVGGYYFTGIKLYLKKKCSSSRHETCQKKKKGPYNNVLIE